MVSTIALRDADTARIYILFIHFKDLFFILAAVRGTRQRIAVFYTRRVHKPNSLYPSIILQNAPSNYVLTLTNGSEILPIDIQTTLKRYGPIARVLDIFFQKLNKENKFALYPAEELEKLLEAIS